jgi:hypothetical protein
MQVPVSERPSAMTVGAVAVVANPPAAMSRLFPPSSMNTSPLLKLVKERDPQARNGFRHSNVIFQPGLWERKRRSGRQFCRDLPEVFHQHDVSIRGFALAKEKRFIVGRHGQAAEERDGLFQSEDGDCLASGKIENVFHRQSRGSQPYLAAAFPRCR